MWTRSCFAAIIFFEIVLRISSMTPIEFERIDMPNHVFKLRRIFLPRLYKNPIDCVATCVHRKDCLGFSKLTNCFILSSRTSPRANEGVSTDTNVSVFVRRSLTLSICPSDAKWRFKSPFSITSVFFVRATSAECLKEGGRPAVLTSREELRHVQKIQAELAKTLLTGASVRSIRHRLRWSWLYGRERFNASVELWVGGKIPETIPGHKGVINDSNTGLTSSIPNGSEKFLCECYFVV